LSVEPVQEIVTWSNDDIETATPLGTEGGIVSPAGVTVSVREDVVEPALLVAVKV